MRILYKGLIVLTLVFLASIAHDPASAQNREAAYQHALSLSEMLAEIDPDRMATAEYRNRAVTLADALKALSYQEASLRAADKAAPPTAAALRPGEVEPAALLGRSPGPEVPLAQVPNEWFYGYLDGARRNMGRMMGMLDTDTGIAEDLSTLSAEILEQTRLIVRPPIDN